MRKSEILKPFVIRFAAVFGFLWLILQAASYFEVQLLVWVRGIPHYFGIFILVSAIISMVSIFIQRRLAGALLYASLSTQAFVARKGRDQFQSAIEAIRSGQSANKEFLESTLTKSATYIYDTINLNSGTHVLQKKEVSRLRDAWDQANLLSKELKAGPIVVDEGQYKHLLKYLEDLEAVEKKIEAERQQHVVKLR